MSIWLTAKDLKRVSHSKLDRNKGVLIIMHNSIHLAPYKKDNFKYYSCHFLLQFLKSSNSYPWVQNTKNGNTQYCDVPHLFLSPPIKQQHHINSDINERNHELDKQVLRFKLVSSFRFDLGSFPLSRINTRNYKSKSSLSNRPKTKIKFFTILVIG